MPVVFQKQVLDQNGTPRQLALDITGATYTLQISGVAVTAAPTQPADSRFVTLTAGVNITLLAQDVGHVGFAGPANISPGLGAQGQAALGRLAALAMNAGVAQSTVFGSIGGG